MPRSATQIIKTDRTGLWFHQGKGIVHHELKGFVQGKEYRDLLSRGLDELKKQKASKWLSDHREYQVVAPEDAQWSQDTWAPAAIAAGFKHWAIVMPEDAIGQSNMKRFADFYASKGVTVETFTTPESALAWLEKR